MGSLFSPKENGSMDPVTASPHPNMSPIEDPKHCRTLQKTVILRQRKRNEKLFKCCLPLSMGLKWVSQLSRLPRAKSQTVISHAGTVSKLRNVAPPAQKGLRMSFRRHNTSDTSTSQASALVPMISMKPSRLPLCHILKPSIPCYPCYPCYDS